jgi:RHS repeat-associated protein
MNTRCNFHYKSGSYSGRIGDNYPVNWEKFVYSDTWTPINNSQDTYYTVSGWIYVENVAKNDAQIWLSTRKSGETGWPSGNYSSKTTQRGRWEYLSKTVLVPADVRELNIRIDNNKKGKVWFDDVKIVKGNASQTVIVEESNYYPFGLKHKGYNNVTSSNGNSVAQKYMYNQGTSGKNFQGKEGKSFKVERQEELGLNLDMTKFRMYDYALGRFTSIDPLADANPQESWTPYQYAYNNPVQYNDPYGDCPQCLWGSIIGAAVDYGLQVSVNLVEGKSLGDSLTDVDGTSILISAGAGALSGGISSISKLQKAGKVVNTAVNVATDTGVSVASQAIKDGDVSLKKTLIDVGAGQIVGNAAGNKAGKSAANSAKGKNLQSKVNQQKNIARGKSNKTPRSKANINKAQTKLDTHVGTRAAASSTTASGAASTAVEKIEKKVNERNN